MWMIVVVLNLPFKRLCVHFNQCLEKAGIKNVFPVSSIEPLDVTVLCRLTRLNKLDLNFVVVATPVQNDF